MLAVAAMIDQKELVYYTVGGYVSMDELNIRVGEALGNNNISSISISIFLFY